MNLQGHDMNHKRLSARGALAPLFTSLFAALVIAG